MQNSVQWSRGITPACCHARARLLHAPALRGSTAPFWSSAADARHGSNIQGLGRYLVSRRRHIRCRSGVELELNGLGLDFLKFLAAFVLITPVFKKINVSPILGFLLAGLLLRQADAISSPKELSDLAELGVLFLLFEMGLELSSDRLRSLSTYAFGLGTVQVFATTAVFVAFAYPFGHSFGTWILQHLAYSDTQVSSITGLEEAIVIAVALSLSSSAFVLQLLGDKGQLASRSGSATLGVLLLQDLVTVPFLVLVPLLARQAPTLDVMQQTAAAAAEFAVTTAPVTTAAASPIPAPPETAEYLAAAVAVEGLPQQAATLAQQFLPTVARSLGLLGGIILLGRVALRRVFGVVAATGSSDAFVAACLLTVCGTAIATDAAGFGYTLGAFMAGVLLAESSFRPQVEAEVKPFKGVLLGLFFLCTGASVDVDVLLSRFPTIALLTVGLLGVKFSITAVSARLFGLSEGESVKVGLTLSQGGEFAFVLLALAQELELLPGELNALLICVVVASMALTPLLADIGAWFEEREQKALMAQEASSLAYELMDPAAPQSVVDQRAAGGNVTAESPVVILGFNEASQVVVNMLSSPLTGNPASWIAFSFNPEAVRDARKRGLPVLFGDGSNINVMRAATDLQPRAFVLTLRAHGQLMDALRNIKKSWPGVPTFALCIDVDRASEAMACGATSAVVTRASAGVALGDALLRNLMDTSSVDLVFLEQEMQLMVKDAVLADVARDAAQAPAGTSGGAAAASGEVATGAVPPAATPDALSPMEVVDDEEDAVAQAVPQTSFMGTLRANRSLNGSAIIEEWPARKRDKCKADGSVDDDSAECDFDPPVTSATASKESEPSSSSGSSSSGSSSKGARSSVSSSPDTSSKTPGSVSSPSQGGRRDSSPVGAQDSIRDSSESSTVPAQLPAPVLHPHGLYRGGGGAARVQVPRGGVALGKKARNVALSSRDGAESSVDEEDLAAVEKGLGDRQEQYARTAAKLRMIDTEAGQQPHPVRGGKPFKPPSNPPKPSPRPSKPPSKHPVPLSTSTSSHDPSDPDL